MAHVQFFQLVLASLITATLLTGGITGALFVRALASNGVQDAAYQPQYAESESPL